MIQIVKVVKQRNIERFLSRIFKIILDYILLFLSVPFITPIFFLIIILIKLQEPDGKVFFTQNRLGKNGEVFKCYKFRSMHTDQSYMIKWLEEHPEEKEYFQKYHKFINDPRVTKIGSLLRKTSLDELPQLINVLKGDMSLVGPRPYLIDEKIKIGDDFNIISLVKPGITGLWQVSGRNEIDFMDRVRLDVKYVNKWSIKNDIKILIKTFRVVINRTGAY